MSKTRQVGERRIHTALLNMMLSSAKKAIAEGDFAHARDCVRCVVIMYPKNAAAKSLLQKIKTRIEAEKKNKKKR